ARRPATAIKMSSSGVSIGGKPNQPAVKAVRVLICAASSFTRAGLERLLEPQPSLHIVSVVNSADALPPAIAQSDPDVVLLRLEAHSPDIGWEELSALDVPIVLLANEADLAIAAAALAAGVHAILLGDAT